MKFLYLVFITIWSIFCIVGVGFFTFNMCRAKKNVELWSSISLWIFFAGVLVQFIAIGIQLIGG
jgi:hypothetical protein